MSKVWQVAESADEAAGLAAKLKISTLTAHLLIQRGFGSPKEANLFLNPCLDQLHAPLQMKGVKLAAKIISEAIHDDDKICVYGDFDVDGLTATALLSEVIKELGGRVFPFVPDRFRHGYGLNGDIIRRLAEKEYKLVVTVDNGIGNHHETELARSLGMRVVVTDHHQPPGTLPVADVIINPKQPGCKYPFKDLAGVGVAFKLAQALAELNGNPEVVFKQLDLVALGTIADIVPLLDENRVLAAEGLRIINESPRLGIAKLKEVGGLQNSVITTGQVSYVLAPRLNAAGRMMSAGDGFELLITKDESKATKLAEKLNQRNQERQQVEEIVLRQALEKVKKEGLAKAKAIVLYSPEWHDGVKGIVASRLIEHFYRPTILFTEVDGVLKGSGRSIPALDMHAALSQCADLLVGFGGHRLAAGVTVKPENYELFQERFLQITNEMISDDDLTETIRIDAAVDLAEISEGLIAEIDSLAPFGAGNPVPKFLTNGVFLDGQSRIGAGEHLKFIVQSNGNAFDAVGFKLKKIDDISGHRSLADIVYQIGQRTWNGRDFIQFRLVDIKLHDKFGRAGQTVKEPPREFIDKLFAAFPDDCRTEDLFFAPTGPASKSAGRFIDRRGMENDDYLKKILARGQTTLIYVSEPKYAAELALRLRESTGNQRVAAFDDRLPNNLKSEALRLYKEGSLTTLVFSGYPKELLNLKELRNLILYHPPFSASAFAVLSGAWQGSGIIFIHLLYNHNDLKGHERFLETMCPDRPALSKFYRLFSDKSTDIDSDEFNLSLRGLFPENDDGRFTETALRIFSELGLIKLAKNQVTLISTENKVTLESSPTYMKSRGLSDDFKKWAKMALSYTPEGILKSIPIK